MALMEKNVRRLIEIEEDAVLDFQFRVIDLLRANGMTKEQLATKLGVSKARVSQLFAPEANPTLKTVARVLAELGQQFTLGVGPSIESGTAQPLWRQARTARATTDERTYSKAIRTFECEVANENWDSKKLVAA